MPSDGRERLEADIRRLCLKGEFDAATTRALRGYGAEVYGFLVGFHRHEPDAADVFSVFAERVWKGLPRFDWASSFRTWAYCIARNASLRHRTTAANRARHFAPLPEGSFLSELAEEVRTATRSYLKTDARDRVAELRESLSAEDRMLLVLRIDRRLPWNDLVRVLREDDAPISAEELARESARLRKRFQVLKDKLITQARRNPDVVGSK